VRGTRITRTGFAAMTVLMLWAPQPARANDERQSGCSQRDWSVEAECEFSYQGTVLVAGMYGTGIVTVEKAGIGGTREVLAWCAADGYGCVTGRGENAESLPIGTPLFCHVRGSSGAKFACLSRTPPTDGEDIRI
jgi:hypothetical protein